MGNPRSWYLLGALVLYLVAVMVVSVVIGRKG
jgi:hypothetical protein